MAAPQAAGGSERGVAATLGRALDRVLDALAIVACAILVALVLGVTYEIVMRYGFNRPTRWVTEFSEYALVYLAFVACAWVLRREGHVRVELLVEVLPPGARRVLHVVTSLVGAAVCLLMAVVGTDYVWGLYQSGEQLFRSVPVPRWAILVIVPFGMLLLGLQFVRRALGPEPGASNVSV